MLYPGNLSRRNFVKLVGAGFVGLQLSGRLSAEDVIAGNPPLIIPETWLSVDGVLGGPFNAVFAEYDIGGGQMVYSRTWAGAIPGPVLRVSPGDAIGLTLNNELPPNTNNDDSNPNLPHSWNSTNLHTHGLHVPCQGNADNPFLDVEPGESLEYFIQLPEDHTGGCYWYHPHVHGGVNQQIRSGMCGALIVNGPLDEVPEIAAATEQVLIFQILEVDYNTTADRWEVPDPVPTAATSDDIFDNCLVFTTLNGQTGMVGDPDTCTTIDHDDQLPCITMQPGEVQRWRIFNLTNEVFMPLTIENEDGELQTFASLAFDGLTFAEPVYETERLVTNGNRLELLFKPTEAGTYYLKKKLYARTGDGPDEKELPHRYLKIVVEGDPLDMDLPTELPVQTVDIQADEVQNTREVIFSVDESTSPESFNLDGRLLDPNRIDQILQLGVTEEWTIRNTSTSDHNFHIHQNPFMVTELNGETLAPPLWADTIIVPRATDDTDGTVKFRTRITDFLGKFYAHCHIGDHGDLGMIQIVQVAQYINGLSMTGNRFIVHYADGLEDRDRVHLFGFFEFSPGQNPALPFGDDVVINLLTSNPDTSANESLLPILTDTISADTVRVRPRIYHYWNRESALRSVTFRRVGGNRMYFRITANRFNFLDAERASLSNNAYRDLIESLTNIRLLISAGDDVWIQDIPVAPRFTTPRAVLLDSPKS